VRGKVGYRVRVGWGTQLAEPIDIGNSPALATPLHTALSVAPRLHSKHRVGCSSGRLSTASNSVASTAYSQALRGQHGARYAGPAQLLGRAGEHQLLQCVVGPGQRHVRAEAVRGAQWGPRRDCSLSELAAAEQLQRALGQHAGRAREAGGAAAAGRGADFSGVSCCGDVASPAWPWSTECLPVGGVARGRPRCVYCTPAPAVAHAAVTQHF